MNNSLPIQQNALSLPATTGLAFLGHRLGALHMISGAETFIHEYIGHGFFGANLCGSFQYTVHNGSFDLFIKNFKNLSNRNLPAGIRINSLRNMIFRQTATQGLITFSRGEFSRLGRILGRNGSIAWIALAAPVLDSIIYNTALGTGIYSTCKGLLEDKNWKIYTGVSLIGFSISPIIGHVAYCGIPTLKIKKIVRRSTQGHDVAIASLYLSKATKISPILFSFGLSTVLLTAPLVVSQFSFQQATQKSKNNSSKNPESSKS